jgi:enoyl-CoA hydratase/carnithine racemase
LSPNSSVGPAVTLAVADGVATITLDRPDARNSLRLADMRLLHQTLEAALRANVRAVLLRGEGGAFCAGRDLKEVDPARDDTRAILAETIAPLLHAVREAPVPTLAAVRGAALGLGFGLALACDIVLAADDALLGSPFRAIGAVLDSGGHYFLRERIGPHRAAELIFTGRLMSGREAAAIGLVNRAVAGLALDAAAQALAREIAAGPTAAFRASKAILVQPRSFAETLALEAAAQAAALAGPDGAEGIAAFKEKRAPKFVGR